MEATQHSTPAPALPPGEWRPRLAAEAGCEICAIAAVLQRDPHDIDPDLIRGLGIRLEHLASVVLSAMGDDHADEAEVSELLHGPEVGRQRARAVRQ
jgi:hypothetical protein